MPRARSCSPRTSTAAPIRRYRVRARVFTEYRLALAVHPQPADPPGARRARELRAGVHHHRPARASGPTRPATAARSETVIACDFTRKIVLIGGTSYAGEMKKSVFTYLNFILPPART